MLIIVFISGQTKQAITMSDERKYMGTISRIILPVVFSDFLFFHIQLFQVHYPSLSPNFYLLITKYLFALIYLLQTFK